MKALIGRKVGMTSMIQEDGTLKAVTVVQAGPVTVTQVKTQDSDGYAAVQVGYGEQQRPNKAHAGHVKTAKVTPRYLREFQIEEDAEVGDNFNVSVFAEGDKVKVSALSKGKGFAGTIKRHNFQRGPKTHGSRNYRKPGSIGSMYPQKIFKGKRMAGRLGGTKTSIRNQTVAFVDEDKNLIGIAGNVPGATRGLVTVEGL